MERRETGQPVRVPPEVRGSTLDRKTGVDAVAVGARDGEPRRGEATRARDE
ncbi:hypothetical protein HUG10_12335 [Halorarum halophilum]|uniref:Uncharacterized protein n=1 Tax=Halorarum halophilum TaxID=2743090 RepID=A0A7D5GCK8_9EURY|nr:hypothetical protein [Halobaculum halophilum]QLG28285.1 hypothetical protein HUG10_12335 [Halobaculum halophilum]